MATRAATFTAKIRNLKDYHSRMVNQVSPLPSGVDVANTLKYFSQTLLGVLKDVPFIPSETYGPRQLDSVRLTMFPNLNYSGVYEAVMNIIDVVPMVQYGQHALGESILNVLSCLVPFLEYDLLDRLPYTVASTLAIFPCTLQKETVELLCTNLIPVTLGYRGMNEKPTYATESTAAIMMMVFQYVEDGKYHSQLLESLMAVKNNICKDLLSVIAYGPPTAKPPAVNHLFHYWPQLNPALTDRRGIHYKYLGWEPISCQRESCPNAGNVRAVKVCLDPSISITCADSPPPLYICVDCVDQLRREHAQYLGDILQPMESVSLVCDNKNCTASDNAAMCTCYSFECASLNRFQPMRYCEACHEMKHGEDEESGHICHLSLPDIWSCDAELQGYLVEAIVSLLKEAQPMEEKRTVEMGEERLRQPHFDDADSEEEDEADERKLLSRYGIWLMVELWKPKEDVPIELLGRLIAMLFQWFDATAYLPDDNVGNALERLKPEYIKKFLHEVSKSHFEVILSCLLPHPPEYAKVGGYWDTLSSRTSQIKEGLNRLFCLVPYDIVNYQVWDYVMPFWLEAIRTEVPLEERQEMKVLLCKSFDTDMSPLPFTLEKMYHFFIERFENTVAAVQEQNLQWLQILSNLEIFIPLNLMLKMFKTGVDSLAKSQGTGAAKGGSGEPSDKPQGPSAFPANVTDDMLPGSPLSPSSANTFSFDQQIDEENVTNLTCFIMMCDIVLKQVELQDSTFHLGVYNETCKDLLGLLALMMSVSWEGEHECTKEDETLTCQCCEMAALWHQLNANLLQFVAPRDVIKLPVKDLPKVEEIQQRSEKHQAEMKERKDGDDQDGKTEEVESPVPEFDIGSLPIHLQLLHSLLKALETLTDADAIFYLLKSVKYLCLHAECLNYTVNDYEEFIHHLLKKLMIPNLWKMLQSEHSQLAALCVPLLLHCLTLPTGADIFWRIIENDFNNEDWRSRFAAVEKVTVLARLIEPDTIKCNQQILTSLAHGFCYLIGSLNDINSSVVQRTMIYLESIKFSSVQCICHCLEFQFDSVISDRTMILRKVYLMSMSLKEHSIFTWEFFLNRFDTLCLEAQLDLEGNGDISGLQDLHSSDRHSDHFLQKINRARFALARTDSIRSVSGSIYAKAPYRRAASVPMHLLTKTLPSFQQKEKEKSPYTRQQSAPQFRSRGSRFGLGMLSNYMFPGGHLREYTDEESNFAALLQRAMDLEGVDRETLHHLVNLLMKFMIHSDQDKVNEDRTMNKAQNIVLRHLNVLLGYNQTEKAFSVPPYKLRYSAVFNAYISGLPQVLDKNFQLGNIILPVSMLLLQYSPSPQRYASDYQPPNYTLWYLEPHTRQSWLMSLMVILYKYQYNTSPASGTVQFLVRLAINTIDAQLHRCRKHDDTFGPASPMIPRNRGRDTSNVSAGDLENILEMETPPRSPTDSQQSECGDTVTISLGSQATSSVQYKRYGAGSDKTDDTDLESLSPTSKVVSPPSRGFPPSGRPQSPPQPTSPTTSPRSRSRSRSRSPPVAKLALGQATFTLGTPPRCKSPTETFVKMQRDQPRRIAEYNRRSLIGDEEDESNRTLEQSVEEYVMGKVSKKGQKSFERDVLAETKKKEIAEIQKPQDVDSKIAEQLRLFESNVVSEKKSDEVVIDEVPDLGDLKVNPIGGKLPLPHIDKHLPHHHVFDKFECVLEEVRESEEEFDSPSRKLSRLPLSKAVSADITVVTKKEADKLPEFEGLKSQKERCMSETHPFPTEADRLPDGESDLEESPLPSPFLPTAKPNFRQRRARKTGLTAIDFQNLLPDMTEGQDKKSPTLGRKSRRSEMLSKSTTPQGSTKLSTSALKANEQIMVDRCHDCSAVLEAYDEDTISMCIVCLATFIHREPALAAPLLQDMLHTVAKIAAHNFYPWQSEISGLVIPGNSVSVARQFLRCVLHQLAPNGIFPQLFMTEIEEPDFLKTMASALMDFSELNCYVALQLLLEGVNELKNVSKEQMMCIVTNMASYMDFITLETSSPSWSNILTQFDIFFRRLPLNLPNPCDMSPVLKSMTSVLKIPGITAIKGILDPFSKLICFTIENCSFKLQQLLDICSLCSRAFNKERDKLFLSRSIIFELVSALKFKLTLPDENLLLLVQFVCLDLGGTLGPVPIVGELANYVYNPYTQSLISTNAAECMKQHLGECVEFVADLHTITKVKNNLKGGAQNLNEDTLGSHLKCGIAQYVALEFTRANGRDNRAISRYLPWLYHPPSTMQQGPREFTDCVGHIRLLSWLLLGSLNHTAVTKGGASIICLPLPLEASSFIADHVMVILSGFAEQSKASVLHMSSLFHAFILCQIWTMYCESYAALNSPQSETYIQAHTTIIDFWARATPGVLQLLSSSQVMAEMVNLHFLGLLEALQECNSSVLSKLFPMWVPILFSYHNQLPGHMQVRLQMCQNWEPKEFRNDASQLDSDVLLKWLKRLQFKLGQIEVQSSAATQFYTV